MNASRKFFLFAASLLILGGCGTTPSGENGAPVENRDGAEVVPVQANTPQGGALPSELTDPNNLLSQRSVFFALDKYNVSNEYRELVNAHGRFLAANRQLKVLIQGHTDERGSREYNLSLGQKRAEAVRQTLLLMGAREEQVEAVSLGEEKPRAEGHDEESWAENRRADILYVGEF